ncbi:EamA-like transporter family protein [Rhodobacter aestuarii]|uniref:EamA-like transporter family protein n=1 Tax=Rhodobacter aestuarii TaxID=453582 RepID=A0A1N7Q0G9_9RHOB|nr:DMT family transporter [Rhodobacter aestuarii]PTV93995.1 EamA-like transporter family protein [Rhodobacter aestuarii]SIT16295.1 EamA-like transporter family protein [Rhodobacter aestuarii]
MTAPRLTPFVWMLLGALALIWGTSFLSNRAALEGAGVLTVVSFRVSGGALALWLYVALRRLPLPAHRGIWGRFLIMGALNNAIPFSLIVWGQQHIESGLAAILNASTALFGVLVASAVFADERLTVPRLAGVGIGFAGVVLAIGPEALSSFTLTSAGQWAVVGASLSYGFAGAYARFAIKGLVPEVAAAGMLTGGMIWLIPAMLLIEGVPSFDYATPVWVGIGWLALGCSAVAYLIYYRILALAGAGNLSLVTLLIPPVAILAGWAVYGERLGLLELAGFAVLAAGLWLLNRAPKTA